MEQLVEIAEGHIAAEDSLVLDANEVICVDTDATTTFMFSMYYHGKVHPRLVKLASETLRRYDLFLVCCTDIPYDDAWDRSGDVNRFAFQQEIKADLLNRKVPFIPLFGTLDKRMQRVITALHAFDKYRSSSPL